MTLPEIIAELSALYTVVTDPKPVQTFEAGVERVDEVQVRLYSVMGKLATEESANIFVVQSSGQAFYARSFPSKVQP